MNRHTKLAIIIAPFLAIGGYIAADFYSSHKASKEPILHQLKVQGNGCFMEQDQCVLSGGGLMLKLSNKHGVTTVLSNHPLVHAVISEAGTSGDAPRQLITEDEKRLIWKIEKEKYAATAGHSMNKIRIAATVGDQTFISEFANQDR